MSDEHSADKLAKSIMKASNEIETLGTLLMWGVCFAVGIILAYLLGVWMLAHMKIVIASVLLCIVWCGYLLWANWE